MKFKIYKISISQLRLFIFLELCLLSFLMIFARSSYASNFNSFSLLFSSLSSRCGNGICESNENIFTCPQDCARRTYCGDGICQPDESPFTCPQDCGVPAYCGDGICQPD
ncbi:MAG: hypothetical protein QW524_03350, partial [Candidatus Woesearchaeota archaeon]